MDAEGILRALAGAGVEFIVIGGVAAFLHGAPLPTLDVDVVHSRGRENRRRLVQVLKGLEACYRDAPVRRAPLAEDLASPLVHLLDTRLGRLDLLGTAHGGLDYEDLLPRTQLVPLEGGIEVRVINIRGLIEMKESVGRDKDRDHVRLLRQIIEEQKRQERPGGS